MNKIKKIIMVMLLFLVLTGCTNYKKYDKTIIVDTENGQKMVDNILCKTENTSIQFNKVKGTYLDQEKQKFENNEITETDYTERINQINDLFNIEDVTECSSFSIMSKTNDGLWTTVFVKSLSWLIIKIGQFTKNYGWSIILVTILIRLVLYPITRKTAMQSENMKKAKSKIDRVEEKYRNRNDKESQMIKAQELMKVYKENNINPASGCIFAIIQIPLFFAFYEALYRLPVVLEETFFGINLGLTPLTAFKMGQYHYIIFIVLVILATLISFKMTSADTNSIQANQMKMVTNFSVIMISIASFSISTGIALYWIINSSFTIAQNLLVKRRKKNDNIT